MTKETKKNIKKMTNYVLKKIIKKYDKKDVANIISFDLISLFNKFDIHYNEYYHNDGIELFKTKLTNKAKRFDIDIFNIIIIKRDINIHYIKCNLLLKNTIKMNLINYILDNNYNAKGLMKKKFIINSDLLSDGLDDLKDDILNQEVIRLDIIDNRMIIDMCIEAVMKEITKRKSNPNIRTIFDILKSSDIDEIIDNVVMDNSNLIDINIIFNSYIKYRYGSLGAYLSEEANYRLDNCMEDLNKTFSYDQIIKFKYKFITKCINESENFINGEKLESYALELFEEIL